MKICKGWGQIAPTPLFYAGRSPAPVMQGAALRLLCRAQPCPCYAGRSPAPVMQGAALQ